MNIKKYIPCIDILDWVSIICAFALHCCVCILQWNALSPAKTWAFQPEILFIAVLLLGGVWMDRWKPAQRILPLVGIILVFVGLVMLLDEGRLEKLLLCAGMGCILCASLYKLWQQVHSPAFVVVICCSVSAGTIMAAIPMILSSNHIWPLLTSGLTVGILVGFLRPSKVLHQTRVPADSLTRGSPSRNIWVVILWGVSSLGTGVSYKWFFGDIPLTAFVHLLLLCTGFCTTGLMITRLGLHRTSNIFWALLIACNLLQLIAHDDSPFTNAVSFLLFGLYFAGFLFSPLFIWEEDVNAFRIALGPVLGLLCQIVAPRTLSIIAPQDWLFETKLGWKLQTCLLALLFFSFCLFNRRQLLIALKQTPFAQSAGNDERLPLPESFTKREYEVAKLVLQGKTNKEIGLHLNIAESTVKTHIGNLLGKTNCSTKTQFIATHHP